MKTVIKLFEFSTDVVTKPMLDPHFREDNETE
jgi:hypothetical protein